MTGSWILADATPEVLVFLGRFHSVMLHLPIGFLVLVFILEVYATFRPGKELRKVIGFVLGMGALGALVVAALGLILAAEGGYDRSALNIHKVLGLTVVSLALITAALHRRGFREQASRTSRNAYRGILGVTVAILMAAGHYGGNLTHGSNYLVEHAPEFVRDLMGEEDESVPVLAEGELSQGQKDYMNHIQPLLSAKCTQCHGPEKQKGGYRLDRPELAMAGGDSGLPAIVPGDPLQSNLVRMLLLPTENDDVMPPDGKESLTPEEIVAVTHWIQNGAEFLGEAGEEAAPAEESGTLPELAAQSSGDGARVGSGSADICDPNEVEAEAEVTVAVPDRRSSDPGEVDFIRDIKPIFEKNCVSCHGAGKDKGGLRLHTRELAFKGGKYEGPGIVPSKPDESSIYLLITIPPDDDPDDLLMPPAKKGGPLDKEEIVRIRNWILAGAAWPAEVTLSDQSSKE